MELLGDYFFNEYHICEKERDADEKIAKYSPADLSEKLWEALVNYGNVEKVIESATQGFKLWRKTTKEHRIEILQKFKINLDKSKDLLANAISLETGKPLWEAYGEIEGALKNIDSVITDSLSLVAPKTIENAAKNSIGKVYYRPIGPCLIIGPFNYPCYSPLCQIVSSLITGNSIVFKPSEKTFASGQILFKALSDTDFPVGVVNLINGPAETVKRLIKHSEIKGIFFTGSRDAGREILKVAGNDLSKLISLELGGKNTTIIHNDINMDNIIYDILCSAYWTSGQRCTATSKIAIHKDIKDKFIEKFHKLAKKIIVDHPTKSEVEPFMGPLINKQAVDNYLLFVGMAKREGAQEIMRGKLLEKAFKGHYVSPSIHYMEKVDEKSLFLNTEIFGPSCTFFPYNEIQEAIEITNTCPFGLVASVYTNDETIKECCINELDVGVIHINRPTIGASMKLPFGGVKNSGNYRPAGLSTIRSTVFPLSSLELSGESPMLNKEHLKGLADN